MTGRPHGGPPVRRGPLLRGGAAGTPEGGGGHRDRAAPRYQPNPWYAPTGGTAETGFGALASAVPSGPVIIALDGPPVLDWAGLVGGLSDALAKRHVPAEALDLRASLLPWEKIVALAASAPLDGDPDFASLARCALSEFFGVMPRPVPPAAGVLLVYGPGSALVRHDLLWYADLPKRYAEAAVKAGARNLGQRSGAGTTRRLFYIDWPVLDRHRDSVAGRIDRFIDTGPMATGGQPSSVSGGILRAALRDLAGRPFRTRPTFSSGSWGGHWAQRTLGSGQELPNTALGYELIAPESGVLIGSADRAVEVPFAMFVAQHPREIMGEAAHASFGTSFPVRFDYLDTLGGGNLSVHVHPRGGCMREVFGWPYPQHETYYLMSGGQDSKVFLGLRDGADIGEFRRRARAAADNGEAFDIERYVQAFPAEPHQLFLIPAGTPHGSGEGNVVLEVSATPYLYSLRFYDWLRRDLDGTLRPVHVEHAFANLDRTRAGGAVAATLRPKPRLLHSGDGYREELLGTLPEMFFEVRRLAVATTAEADTEDRFHVLNVVGGEGVAIETASGHEHLLSYAETIVVPASVGRYRLTRLGGTAPCRIVKALTR